MGRRRIATNNQDQAYMKNSDGKLIRIESGVPFKILEITENGTYNSLDYGHLGWSQVKTKIPILKAEFKSPFIINGIYNAKDRFNTTYYEPGAYFDQFAVVDSLKNHLTSIWELEVNKYGYLKRASSSIEADELKDSLTVLIPPYLCYLKTSLKDFIFNPNILLVGEYAFYNTDIKRVYLPIANRVNDYAFFGNKNSEELILTSRLTSIGQHAFEKCPFNNTHTLTLSGVATELEVGLTSIINNSAFYDSLKEVTNLTIKDFSTIDISAFSNSCKAESECRIQNVRTINTAAFYNSGIKYMIFMGNRIPSLSSRNAIDSGSGNRKFYVPYDQYGAYKTTTNWVNVSPLYGWGSFSAGVTLPMTTSDGLYRLEWHSDKDLQSAVLTKAIKDGEIYCKVTGV